MNPEQYDQLYQEVKDQKKRSTAYKIRNNYLFVKHNDWKRVIKKPDQEEIIRMIHDQAHSGKRRTLSEIKELYWWPGMMNHVTEYIESCDSCQRDSRPRHKYPLQPIPVSAPWEIVGIDHVGPLEKSKGKYEYLIVAQDYLTKWPIAEPTKTTNTEEALRFVRDRIMTVFGCPKQIISDQGTAFTSKLWKATMETWQIKHVTTSAAHPQANGLVERMNQTILKSLRRTLGEQKDLWPEVLQTILATYRNTPHSTTNITPAKLVLGKKIRLPIENRYETDDMDETDWNQTLKKRMAEIEAIQPNQIEAARQIRVKQQKMKEYHDRGITERKAKKFQVGELVLLYGPKQSKLGTIGTGPFRIRRIKGKNSYELETLGGTIHTRSAHATRLETYKDRGGNVRIEV